MRSERSHLQISRYLPGPESNLRSAHFCRYTGARLIAQYICAVLLRAFAKADAPNYPAWQRE